MSFLQNLQNMIGGADLQRLAGGQGNFGDPNSGDHQHLQQMMSGMDASSLEQLFGQAAGQMDSRQYADHVTPGVGGTNPLGSLGSGGLSTVASMLMNHLMHSGGYSSNSLLSKIPGLNTTDPQQMDANQVAAVASYTQQNHPNLFAKIAAMLGKQNPNLLQSFLGSGGMQAIAQRLAGQFMGR
jgi:hypothetical protein